MQSNTPSKYVGLDLIVNQHAMRKRAGIGKTLLGAADIGSYFIPGVGTARLGWDALKGYGRGIKHLSRGNFKKGLGGIGTGLADTLFAAASLIPGGAALAHVGKAGRLARIAALAGKGGRVGKLLTKISPTKLQAIGRLGHKMKTVPKLITPASRLGRFGAGAGTLGLSMGGGMLESVLPEEIIKRPVKGVVGAQPWRRRPGWARLK